MSNSSYRDGAGPSSSHGFSESERPSDVKSTRTTGTSATVTKPLLPSGIIGDVHSISSVSRAGSDAAVDYHDEDDYPEGGLRAWLVVFGSWLALFASLGLMNVLATFDTYVSAKDLPKHGAGTIGGVISVYSLLSFALGIYVGPFFDRYGPRYLILAGIMCLVISLIIVSISTRQWHLIASFGILSGLGSALLFTPSIAAIGHFFQKRRGLATGVATTAGSVSAVVFPFMVEKLFQKVGWPWAMRALALICLAVTIGANFLIRSRLPPLSDQVSKVPRPDPRMFAIKGLPLAAVAIFLMQFAAFLPLSYLSAFVLSKGFSDRFSFDVITILNAASAFGRVVAGFLADIIGPFNASIIFTFLTSIACFAIWLPVGASKGGLIAFALVFGFTSGSNVSLMPVTIGKLCPTRNYGRYFGTVYTIVSLAALMAIPVVNAVVTSQRGNYWGVVVMSGAFYAASAVVFGAARVSIVGWRFWTAF
ncbi:putative transporter [Podospora fimiseda]|uniref:Transporter n=1 Tax=Podospora fimiseda TaxID=252190 RepID=A0AAN7BSR7_9PEZI|nr:putative transporter [Podospora fimiseda]